MLSNKNHYKHALIFGSITGGVIFFVLMLGFILGSANNQSMQAFAMVLFITGVMFSVKRYRDFHSQESFSYKKAFGTSYLTTLIAGIIWAVYGFILYKASPGLLEEKMHQAQEAYLQMGMNEEDTLEAISMSSPLLMAWSYIVSAAIYGGILSLIVGAIFYRKKNPLLIQNDDNQL